MSSKIKYYGTKKGDHIVLLNLDKLSLNVFLQKFDDGTEMEVTVSKRRKVRTSKQPGEDTNFNGYLWGVVYKIIGDEIGEMDLDYIHHWLQIKTGNIKAMPDGLIVPAGTSKMTGGEFAEYCSRVRIWASTPGNICGLGLFVPQPYEDM